MRLIAIRLAASSVLSCLALVVAVAAGPLPVPPVKPGLWEARMSALDADGHEMASPEQAALSRLPPEARARMADAMKARGVSMPDANGATKVCLTKEMFESGRWQQMASDAGCTTNYSTLSVPPGNGIRAVRRSSPSRMARRCSTARRATGPR